MGEQHITSLVVSHIHQLKGLFLNLIFMKYAPENL